ncbi:hypothetical protein [Candidatus Contendibacter odensensis]|uniref:Uncharacterized protein n=1 Tax=Candidatus Contendobacter odensis Run_B_J11 TaxID=1400861 RepID=A0A7U7J4B8_9GAMM|nr:hypothetical protein [Candidatus Contendobacter odensis]CDH46098.1 hypothetical protein BN874_340058 [Candidatus Contendobacter odensis Run_B_J11]
MVDFASQIDTEARQMLEHLGEIRGQLQQAGARVTEAQQQADTLIAETQAAYEQLTHRLQTVRQRADQVREGVTTQVSHLTQQVEHLIQQVEQGHQQVTATYGQVSTVLGALVNDASQRHTELQGYTDQNSQQGQELLGTVEHLLSAMQQEAQQAETVYGQKVMVQAQQWGQHLQQLAGGARQELSSGLEQHVRGGSQQFATHLHETAGRFSQKLTASAQRVSEQGQQVMQTFNHQQQDRLRKLGEDANKLKDHLFSVAENFQKLTHGATEATGTVVKGMDAVNVGLKTAVGTLNNVKSILEDIGTLI